MEKFNNRRGRNPANIVGKRYGRLVAIKQSRKYKDTYYWIFQCDCGREKEILLANVTRKKESTTSCGCLRQVATEHLGSAEKVNFIRNGLRRLWLKWPPRYHTRNAAFVGKQVNKETGRIAKHYECAACHGKFPQTKIQVDHIERVGEIKDWTEHIEKLFCSAKNLQILCDSCHAVKTKGEVTRFVTSKRKAKKCKLKELSKTTKAT